MRVETWQFQFGKGSTDTAVQEPTNSTDTAVHGPTNSTDTAVQEPTNSTDTAVQEAITTNFFERPPFIIFSFFSFRSMKYLFKSF